ncbi:MAG: metal-sulfur cluster assembly factor [Solirubrobacterales bacterium]|nr:metal-sulfur cluster assembly factor [Solirubrobacterales bacterium]MBV9717371.1 metal-sulfur cluster assembly factor [Solirubrobacterales bacterium]
MSATVAELEAALRDVHDPEYPISVLDMGLIRGLRVLQGGTAQVRLTYTSMGCPCKEMIADDVRDALLAVDGIDRVEVEEVFEPWTHRDLSRRARRTLHELGVT